MKTKAFVLLCFFCVCVGLPLFAQTKPVQTDLERPFDKNKNGRLEADEIKVLIETLRQALEGPHPVKTSIDALIDKNRDKNERIEEFEIIDMRRFIFQDIIGGPRPVQGDEDAPFDLNKDKRITDEEIKFIWKFLIEGQFRNPRTTDNPLDQSLDKNRNKKVEEKEINETLLFFYQIAVFRKTYFRPGGLLSPEEQEAFKVAIKKGPHKVQTFVDEALDFNHNGSVDDFEIEEVSRVTEGEKREGKNPVLHMLDKLTDANNNGMLEEEELAMREEAFRGNHPVETEFDRRIDFNGNGLVESFEIKKAQQQSEIPVEGKEPQGQQFFPVLTKIDAVWDLNRDGKVSIEEWHRSAEIFMKGEHAVDRGFPPDVSFDFNKDNRITMDELQTATELFIQPHPVRSDLDKTLDKNSDKFVDELEIGLAMGITEGGKKVLPSFEELKQSRAIQEDIATEEGTETTDSGKSSSASSKSSSSSSSAATTTTTTEKQKKVPSLIRGKKVAIVDISTETADASNKEAIYDFIGNAFVNAETVTVVDRSSIDKIIKEQQFQATDLADESTAVRIGKLAGADIIVVGSLRKVSEKYYLNIKLIVVETAEVIGSRISTGSSSSDFYDMCNDAVYKLFE